MEPRLRPGAVHGNDRGGAPAHGDSALLLALPLIIFMMAYLPNAGLRASSIFRYESAGVPLFMVLAVWLSIPTRKPLLISLMAFSLLVQVYYAFLYSRGLWIR